MTSALINSLVTGRDHNVIRVDFRRDPDRPGPRFPGAAAARQPTPPLDSAWQSIAPKRTGMGAAT